MEKAPFAADSSRCLTRGQYSSDARRVRSPAPQMTRLGERLRTSCTHGLEGVDKAERRREAFLSQAHLVARPRVHRGVDMATEIAQLLGAEHHLAHARLASAEDEVVRAHT